jgi:hypothetical protein
VATILAVVQVLSQIEPGQKDGQNGVYVGGVFVAITTTTIVVGYVIIKSLSNRK